jgi:hypothetical protein
MSVVGTFCCHDKGGPDENFPPRTVGVVLGNDFSVLFHQLMRLVVAKNIAYSERVNETSNVNQTRGSLENKRVLRMESGALNKAAQPSID